MAAGVVILSGVVPIGGRQSNLTVVSSTAIILPTTAQRAQLGGPGTEFKIVAMPVLEMWLTVKVASVNVRTDGAAATNGADHLIAVTNAPVVFVGERMIRALRFIEAVGANGATISYSFFFQEP